MENQTTKTIKNFKLIFSNPKTIDSDDYFSLIDLGGLTITPKDGSPNLWDADSMFPAQFRISGDDIVISGGLDSNGYGEVVIRFPHTDISTYYDIIIEPVSIQDFSDAVTILKKYGYTLELVE